MKIATTAIALCGLLLLAAVSVAMADHVKGLGVGDSAIMSGGLSDHFKLTARKIRDGTLMRDGGDTGGAILSLSGPPTNVSKIELSCFIAKGDDVGVKQDLMYIEQLAHNLALGWDCMSWLNDATGRAEAVKDGSAQIDYHGIRFRFESQSPIGFSFVITHA